MAEIHHLQTRIDAAKAELDRERSIETGGGPPHDPPMELGERLARVESGLDWIKVILTIFGAVMIGGFAFLGVQFNRLDGRIDQVGTKIEAIPQRLSEEFRAMRAEMSAQTSAIANAVTAAHQGGAPPAPQIIIVPMPQPGPSPVPGQPKP